MKLQQMIVIAAIIDCGSLLRAANQMGMTQPALTKVVRELEGFFGAPLFERSNRGVTPTELGSLLGRRAKSMMSELRYLSDEVNVLRGGSSGHVIVGTLITASARLLPMAIARLKAQAPHMLVTVIEASNAQLFPALAAGDIDIVVGRLPEREPRTAGTLALRYEVLFRETMCIVAGAHHRLGLSAAPHLRELHALPWILPLADSPSRARVEQLFEDANLPLPGNHVESLSMLTNLGLLLQTPCLGVMPRAAAQQFIDAGLLRVIDTPTSNDFGAIGFSARADKQPSAACQRFIDCLREAARVIATPTSPQG